MENHILVGLGGTGGKILRQFKMRLFEEFPDERERRNLPIGLLYVDTTREMMGLARPENNVLGQDAGFTEAEFLNIRGVDVTSIIDSINNYPSLKGIVDNVAGVRSAIGNLGEAAGQKRRAGRLLFGVNAQEFQSKLKDTYAKIQNDRENKSDATTERTVHIFAGLSGGTGSGAIIDALAQTRRLWPESRVLVYVMLPERDLKAGVDKGRYYPNAYAALRELNALQTGRFNPSDVLPDGMPIKFFDLKPTAKGVADGLFVYSNTNSAHQSVDSYKELPRVVSDFVYAHIFQMDNNNQDYDDIRRAFNIENLDSAAFEKDETVDPEAVEAGMEIDAVRTAKISSFGIKRVIYPETRILKHVELTVGNRLLNQIKFNNWSESRGFIDEPVNRDYRNTFLSAKQLEAWMLDMAHITLEKKVLPMDEAFKPFAQDWQIRIDGLHDTLADNECPPVAMRDAMNKQYEGNFRKCGVPKYYADKTKVARDIAHEIRSNIEKDLFAQWRSGKLSLMDLAQVTDLLAAYVAGDLRDEIEKAIVATDAKAATAERTVKEIIDDWQKSGFLMGKLLGKKKDYYTESNQVLGNLMAERTRQEGLKFAKALQQNLVIEFNAFVEGVASFLLLVTEAMARTEELLGGQKKRIPGLENITGPIVEVCEEEGMAQFETSMSLDADVMKSASTGLRELLVGDKDFIDFGDLTVRLSVEDFLSAFDTQVIAAVRKFHDALPVAATKVLGLNILEQLSQKLDTDVKIKEFARNILRQTAPFVDLNNAETIKHINNNDMMTLGKDRHIMETLLVMPDVSKMPALDRFAKKLVQAFQDNKEGSRLTVSYNGRPEELYIVSIVCGFPMRSITWLRDDLRKYYAALHTGNRVTDQNNAILLHSEGDGTQLPDIFAKSAEECEVLYAEQRKAREAEVAATAPAAPAPQPAGPAAPPMPGAPVPPPMPGVPAPDPVVNMWLFIGGQQYGPYDYATLKQFKTTGQLTPDTQVWEEGMAAWMPAKQAPKLQGLFAPVPPAPGVPPMPPTPGMPPMPPAM